LEAIIAVATSEARKLLFEGLVIVASILAAFSLDTWWDSTQDRAEEQEALVALDAEFRTARQELESHLAIHRRVLGSVGFVRSSLAQALETGSATVTLPDTALGWLYVPPTTQVVLGTLDGLVGSSRLGIIRDRELRTALAAWGHKLGEMNEEEWASREFVFTDLDRVLRSRANVDPYRWIGKDLLAETLDESQRYAKSVIRVDEEIVGVLATRYAIIDHGMDEFEPVFDEIDNLLRLIDRSRHD
jgi:hypothetical protein